MCRPLLTLTLWLSLYFTEAAEVRDNSQLYGVETAKLTEAVIAAFKNDTKHAVAIIDSDTQTLLYPDFIYTIRLLNIRHVCKVDKIEEIIHDWLDGDYSTGNTEFSILLDEYLLGDILASPETLSDSGLLAKIRVDAPAAYWDSWPSSAHFNTYGKRLGKLQQSLERDDLILGDDDNEIFAYHNLKWHVEQVVDFDKNWYLYEYTVSQLGSLQSHIMGLASVNLETETQCLAWIKRLQTFRLKYEHYKEHFDKAAVLNMNPPNYIIEKVIRSIERVVAVLSRDVYANPLVYTLVNNYKYNLQAEVPEELKTDTAQAIQNVVVPVLQDFLGLLYSAIVKGRNVGGPGLWSRPNGTAYYEKCVKKYTTTYYTADQLHQLGLVEVAKIRKQVKGLVQKLNDRGDYLVSHTSTTAQILQGIRTNELFYYNTTDKEGVISSIKNIMSIVKSKMKDYFKSTASMPIDVEAMSREEESSQPIATYSPADQFSPNGTFNINLGQKLSKIIMRSLVCHEAIPGHHFHVSRILSKPSLRKLYEGEISYSSSLEGWAMYSEKLCGEMGVMDVPTHDLLDTSVIYYSIGRLTSEIFRAARLVVDTGIHTKKWTRAKAINFMQRNTDAPLEMIQSEIARYVVWPGQALSYYTGLMEMSALRSEVEEKEGTQFDIKEFHETILNTGSLPLAVLRSYVVEKYGLEQ